MVNILYCLVKTIRTHTIVFYESKPVSSVLDHLFHKWMCSGQHNPGIPMGI